MTINRRNSQESVEPFEGAEILKMADSSTGSKMMSVVDLTVKPGITSAYHRHPNTEESIFVVEGDVEFRVGNHKFKASPGDCILAPKGVGHGLANIGNIDARFICGYPNANPLREEISEPELFSIPCSTVNIYFSSMDIFFFFNKLFRVFNNFSLDKSNTF